MVLSYDKLWNYWCSRTQEKFKINHIHTQGNKKIEVNKTKKNN